MIAITRTRERHVFFPHRIVDHAQPAVADGDETLRRALRYVGMGAAAALALVAVVAVWPDPLPPPKAKVVKAVPTAVPKVVPTAAPKALPIPTQAAATTAPSEPEPKRPPRRVQPELEVPAVTRVVSVKLTGVLGGTLRIDGEPKQWFGVTHELALGDHTFEFVPPNDNCCELVRKTVQIREGEGTQEVRGRIPFRDALLRATGASVEGLILSCPAVFAGSLALPGQRSVPMSEETWTGICTLSGPQEGSERRQKRITLRAGDTTVLSGP
jgi:hypothetical protein